MSPDSLFDEAPSPHGTLVKTDIPNVGNEAQSPAKSNSVTGESAPLSSATGKIRKNFTLQDQDMLENRYSGDISPSSANPSIHLAVSPVGGPLGYLPSAPGTHVRYVEVTKDEATKRISTYRRKIQTLQYQRDKYMRASTEWTAVDPATGKTKEQIMREEPRRLKRALNFQEKKTEEFKLNAELWRGRYQQLQVAYNNLQHQHYAVTQWATNVSYAPHPIFSPPRSALTPPAHPAPTIPSQTPAGSVTIDLTCDDVDNTNSGSSQHRARDYAEW
jgi:hypothetical protein